MLFLNPSSQGRHGLETDWWLESLKPGSGIHNPRSTHQACSCSPADPMASAGYGGTAQTSALIWIAWRLRAIAKVRTKCLEQLALSVKYCLSRFEGQFHALASSFWKDFLNHTLLPSGAGHDSSMMCLFLGEYLQWWIFICQRNPQR